MLSISIAILVIVVLIMGSVLMSMILLLDKGARPTEVETRSWQDASQIEILNGRVEMLEDALDQMVEAVSDGFMQCMKSGPHRPEDVFGETWRK